METWDILLIGKTGLGKSTTAIKLQEWDKYESSIKSLNPNDGTVMNAPAKKPVSGNSLKSVTAELQAWENPVTKVRVVDVPGFGGTEPHPLLDVWKQNLAIVHRISKLISTERSETSTDNNPFKFRRILYFFPTRGVPVRIVPCLKKELELLFKFFGDLIFRLMVVVCTNRPEDNYQEVGFDDEDLKAIKRMLMFALKDITETDHSELEVMYIERKNSVNDTETLLDRVKKTYEGKTGSTLEVDVSACVIGQGNHPEVTEKTDKQAKIKGWLSNLLHYNRPPTKSKCHPAFRVEGQTGYFINIAPVSEDDQRIYEFYFEAKCVNCNKSPGTEGCAETAKHATSIDYSKSTNSHQHQDGLLSDPNKQYSALNQGAAGGGGQQALSQGAAGGGNQQDQQALNQGAAGGGHEQALSLGAAGGGHEQALSLGAAGGGHEQALSLGAAGGGHEQALSLGAEGGGVQQALSQGSVGGGVQQALSLGAAGGGHEQALSLGAAGGGVQQALSQGAAGGGVQQALSLGAAGGGVQQALSQGAEGGGVQQDQQALNQGAAGGDGQQALNQGAAGGGHEQALSLGAAGGGHEQALSLGAAGGGHEQALSLGAAGGGHEQALSLGAEGGGVQQALSQGSVGGGVQQALSLGAAGGGHEQALSLGAAGGGVQQALSQGAAGGGVQQALSLGAAGGGVQQALSQGAEGGGVQQALSLGAAGGPPLPPPPVTWLATAASKVELEQVKKEEDQSKKYEGKKVTRCGVGRGQGLFSEGRKCAFLVFPCIWYVLHVWVGTCMGRYMYG